MTTLVRAVYRDGVLHPIEPLELPDNTPVVVSVSVAGEVDTDETERERREIHEILVSSGLVRPGPVPGPITSTLSPEREAELAQKLAKARPLSAIIREERDSN